MPEDCAANMLSVNGTLIHRSAAEAPDTCKVSEIIFTIHTNFIILKSFMDLTLKIFASELQMMEAKGELQRRELSVSELAKVGSGLSSCCLLVKRTRAARTF